MDMNGLQGTKAAVSKQERHVDLVEEKNGQKERSVLCAFLSLERGEG